MSSRVSLISVQ